MTTPNRPLSPHLQVYKPQLTSVLSITHRITGFALAIGTFLFAWWLCAAATGPDAFAQVHECLNHPIGKVMIIGWLWSLSYHMLNGIRHLVWDMGKWLSLPAIYRSGWATLILSFLLTAAVWCAAAGNWGM